jgi:hypothetical protein
MIYTNSANASRSARNATPVHLGPILLMWTLYVLSPLLVSFHTGADTRFFAASVLFSIISFALAVWLVLQRNVADMLNGGIKLILDAVVTVALLCVLVHSGFLATMLASLHP